MNSNLIPIGNIPVSSSEIASFLPNVGQRRDRRLHTLERNGEVIRLKRDLYVVHPNVAQQTLSTELIANHLCAPSYVSMSSALRYYGLIPEAVYITQSMTLKGAKSFDTPIGKFTFTHIAKEAFPIGVTFIQKEGYAFLIATPEKALCDLIATTRGLNLRFFKDVRAYLEEDLRLDMNCLNSFNFDILNQYANLGKKADSIRTLIKFLQK